MIYKSKIGDIDLTKVTKLYPAAVVNAHGEVAEMSLEWADLNGNKVEITSYVLVFDFTLPKQEERDKKELHFNTKDELIAAMQEVSQFYQD
ncbi:MAG: hypothetical protein A2513_08295 [Sulfurimonas sp. RIFOXYD12_FULL_33_39]|nr:MAG: hypothetical protein A3G74_08965 [Sulfurimonas sp. RIFCSPLOWO2_12_FULL_34_6]OHE10264.1 MAG: hypothetical protein A2513_08295 [Sulfurimonas sp. RIFOXYD12_FULL_33_39]OHE14822.1 MAG: hypothetical protein A2530_02185 [Sulfurimonas sp. RIFOXYD2_FULL_34_21]DAB28794.1 MAG TPA: hypothetical protein CFH78_00585 [Sulfurimonas sp. UBA10385]